MLRLSNGDTSVSSAYPYVPSSRSAFV